MDTTYDVRIWSTQEKVGARGKTYVVRWRVAGRRWKATFKTAALADSFRSDLLAAARKGEAFDTGTGRPVSMLRASKDMSWYSFACAFAWSSPQPWSPASEVSRTASSSVLR